MGDEHPQCDLHNWKCPPVTPNDVGLVRLSRASDDVIRRHHHRLLHAATGTATSHRHPVSRHRDPRAISPPHDVE
jgi:hypothetical protein